MSVFGLQSLWDYYFICMKLGSNSVNSIWEWGPWMSWVLCMCPAPPNPVLCLPHLNCCQMPVWALVSGCVGIRNVVKIHVLTDVFFSPRPFWQKVNYTTNCDVPQNSVSKPNQQSLVWFRCFPCWISIPLHFKKNWFLLFGKMTVSKDN